MKDDSENESSEEEEMVDAMEHENNLQKNAHYIKIIINSVKKAIYNALFNYFDSPPKAALLASILDSRFKKMRKWPEETRLNAISLLKEEFLLIKGKETTVIQRNSRPAYLIGGFKSRFTGQMKGNHVTVCHEISVRFQ